MIRYIEYFFTEWYYMNDFFYITGRDIGMILLGAAVMYVLIFTFLSLLQKEDKS